MGGESRPNASQGLFEVVLTRGQLLPSTNVRFSALTRRRTGVWIRLLGGGHQSKSYPTPTPSHPIPSHPTGSGDFAALAVEGCCAQHMPGAQMGRARLPGLMSGGPQRPQKLSTSSESLLPSGMEGVRAGVWTGGGGSKRGVISRGLTMRTCWPQTPSLSPGVRFPIQTL